jgi:hypothetical protein
VIALAITGGLLGYLLSQIDPGELVAAARGMTPRHVSAFLALLLAGVAARAVRFRLLLGPPVNMSLLTGIVLVRNLFVDLLPARLGELSYVYMLTSRAGRRIEEGLASLMLSVAFDVVALMPLLLLALLTVGSSGLVAGPWLAAAAVVLGAVAFGGARLAGPLGHFAARVLAPPGGSAAGRRAALAGLMRRTALALDDAWARGIAVPVLAVSIVVRLCKFGSYFFLVLAILGPRVDSATDLGFFRVFIGVLSAELAAALPIPTIASFGTFEAAWTVSFVQLGFAREDAIVSGVVAHATSQAVEYAIGGLALLVLLWPQRGGSGVG